MLNKYFDDEKIRNEEILLFRIHKLTKDCNTGNVGVTQFFCERGEILCGWAEMRNDNFLEDKGVREISWEQGVRDL